MLSTNNYNLGWETPRNEGVSIKMSGFFLLSFIVILCSGGRGLFLGGKGGFLHQLVILIAAQSSLAIFDTENR